VSRFSLFEDPQNRAFKYRHSKIAQLVCRPISTQHVGKKFRFTMPLNTSAFAMKRHREASSAPIKELFRPQKHAKAVAYLENWGKTFWEDTDYRIKEATTKLEKDLKGRSFRQAAGQHPASSRFAPLP
jgi:hypothetical protein